MRLLKHHGAHILNNSFHCGNKTIVRDDYFVNTMSTINNSQSEFLFFSFGVSKHKSHAVNDDDYR